MKKIGFVTHWFGWDIAGGAEAELRGLVTHLAEAGQELEILTTCVKSFNSDWSKNYYRPGLTIEQNIPIRRFPVRKRDTEAFDAVNAKLMNHQLPLTAQEEKIYVEEMINSPELYIYLRDHADEYSVFVFIPYMFGTTYFGMKEVPRKAVLIPCLHDESYIYMDVFKSLFSGIAGMIFHARPEYELAERVYDLSKVKTAVLGEGVYTDLTSDAERFREKYRIHAPFLLYAGRKDAGKNVDTLVKYFRRYVNGRETDLQLVLIGGGEITIPREIKARVHDLGFVDVQDKYDAYAAAELLCQPSKNESFSLVIMESWLCGRPVLVSGECAVTRNFVQESNGGLYFAGYSEFEKCVDYLVNRKEEAKALGAQGRSYVLEHFSWDVIVKRYLAFFEEIAS